VLKTMWDAKREADPLFASGIGTSTCDMDADNKIWQQFKEGKFDPFSTGTSETNYEDRLKYCVFILGRYFLCRGQREIVFSKWKQVKFSTVIEDGVKQECAEFIHKYDKSHQLKLTYPVLRATVPLRMYANANDEL
jgi:hypothetical protein